MSDIYLLSSFGVRYAPPLFSKNLTSIYSTFELVLLTFGKAIFAPIYCHLVALYDITGGKKGMNMKLAISW